MNDDKEGISLDFNSKFLVVGVIVCLFLIGRGIFMFGADVVCSNSGGDLYKHNNSVVCVIKSDLGACVDVSGDVKSKSWIDDLNISFVDVDLGGDSIG